MKNKDKGDEEMGEGGQEARQRRDEDGIGGREERGGDADVCICGPLRPTIG